MALPNSPPHDIIVAPAVGEPGRDALREQCYAVRIDVFHHEQGFPLDTEIDDLDESATHILLRLTPELKPVGTIRCSYNEQKGYYKLSRLAVLKDYRQLKFGRELVIALHEYVERDAARRGLDSAKIICHSQLPVKGFYANFRYFPEGEEFDEDGAPHQLMVARLSLSR